MNNNEIEALYECRNKMHLDVFLEEEKLSFSKPASTLGKSHEELELRFYKFVYKVKAFNNRFSFLWRRSGWVINEWFVCIWAHWLKILHPTKEFY